MGKAIKLRDVNTAVRIYYACPEISTGEIRELFGNLAASTISRMKKEVFAEMEKRGIPRNKGSAVDTRTAFEVWHYDIADLELRKRKLDRYGYNTAASA